MRNDAVSQPNDQGGVGPGGCRKGRRANRRPAANRWPGYRRIGPRDGLPASTRRRPPAKRKHRRKGHLPATPTAPREGLGKQGLPAVGTLRRAPRRSFPVSIHSVSNEAGKHLCLPLVLRGVARTTGHPEDQRRVQTDDAGRGGVHGQTPRVIHVYVYQFVREDVTLVMHGNILLIEDKVAIGSLDSDPARRVEMSSGIQRLHQDGLPPPLRDGVTELASREPVGQSQAVDTPLIGFTYALVTHESETLPTPPAVRATPCMLTPTNPTRDSVDSDVIGMTKALAYALPHCHPGGVAGPPPRGRSAFAPTVRLEETALKSADPTSRGSSSVARPATPFSTCWPASAPAPPPLPDPVTVGPMRLRHGW